MQTVVALCVYFVLLLGVVFIARILGRLSLIRTAFEIVCCAPLVLLIAAFLVLGVYGWLGEVYGVAYQIWHQNPDDQLLGGIAASMLVAGLLLASLLITPRRTELLQRKALITDKIFAVCLRTVKRPRAVGAESDGKRREETLPYQYMRFLAIWFVPSLVILALPVAALAANAPCPIFNYSDALYQQTDGWPWLIGLITGALISLVAVTCLVWLCLRLRSLSCFADLKESRAIVSFRVLPALVISGLRSKSEQPATEISGEPSDRTDQFRDNRDEAPAAAEPNEPSSRPDGYKTDLVRLSAIAAFALFLFFSIGVGLEWHPPPMVSACSLAALVTAIYVMLCHRNPFAQLPAALILLLVLTLVNGFSLNGPPRFKLRFPNGDHATGLEHYYNQRVNLNQQEYIEQSATNPNPDLLKDENVLETWLHQCQAGYRARHGEVPKEWKPKLVVVTTSGGASLAAVWTTVVLNELEGRFAKVDESFPGHVRLITGASGGMLGAGYYVASLDEPGPKGDYPRREERAKELVDHLSADFLTPVVSQGVFRDLPTLLCPSARTHDRGTELEEAWWRATARPNAEGVLSPDASPLARPFHDLADGEDCGWRPSLVYSPMFVEDGRRLLISNLNLFTLGRNRLPTVKSNPVQENQKPREVVGIEDYYYSLGAIEFFQIFPEARGLRLSTAIRMSATFPYISPAVYLPTEPPRRVVDAGYFDNYGVHLAASWIRENRRWLVLNTSGVLLVQIRAFGEEEDRIKFTSEDVPAANHEGDSAGKRRDGAGKKDGSLVPSLGAGSEWLTTPVAGLVNSWRGVMAYRNDEQAEFLSAILNGQDFVFRDGDPNKPWGKNNTGPAVGQPMTVRTPAGFFRTVVFEAPSNVSMSWYLTDYEKTLLKQGMSKPTGQAVDGGELAKLTVDMQAKNQARIESLIDWWKEQPTVAIRRDGAVARK